MSHNLDRSTHTNGKQATSTQLTMNRTSLTLLISLSTIVLSPAALWLIPQPVAIAQPTVAPPIDTAKLRQIAQSITVKISANGKSGSGVIVSKRGQVYTVLTNAHVLIPGKPYRIQTPDGKTHTGNLPTQKLRWQGKDLGIIEFSSNSDYTIAKLGNTVPVAVNQQIVAAGFAYDSQQLVFTEGKVSLLPDKPLKRGYQIGYTNQIRQGMSGGPILNYQGEVIGLNGLLANAVLSNPYIYADGSPPSPTERRQMQQSSWGIPIQNAGEIVSEFVAITDTPAKTPVKNPTGSNNTPPVSQTDETPPKMGVVKKVDEIAEQITVLITESKGSKNGSGAIVAKKGNTYYILTAHHVIKSSGTYIVTAPDGKQYPVNYSQIKRLEGVDLAVVPFTSDRSYRVATLGNYKLLADEPNNNTSSEYVFVSGLPASKKNSQGKYQRLFTAGRLTAPEYVRFQVYSPVALQVSAEGVQVGGGSQRIEYRVPTDAYELLYSNITFGGMSGGAVLDTQGRVIGIHGRADGERLFKELRMGKSLGIPIGTFLSLAKQTGIESSLKTETTPPKTLNKTESQAIQDYIVPVDSIPQDNASAEDWLNYANQLWRVKQDTAAIQAFDRAIKLKPDFYQAWYGKGLTLRGQDKNTEALAAFDKAIQINPEFSQGWRQKGITLNSLEKYPEALKAIDRAISLKSSDDLQLLFLKGSVLNSLERYPEAVESYSRAIKINPNPTVFVQRGISYFFLKNYQKALADYTEAIRLKPNDALFYSLRGSVHSLLINNYQKAIADYNEAIRLKPNDANTYKLRGSSYFFLKNYQKALADYNEAIRLKPNDPDAYRLRGSAYFSLNDYQKAIADFNEAIRLNPNDADAYEFRGNTYSVGLFDSQKAIADYTKQDLRKSHRN